MRRRITIVAAALGLSAVVLPALAAAECETVLPTSAVTVGMTGIGMTVSQGTTPEPFDVEVLGILENGIGPGRDMIIVDTSSPAIDAVGGIWAGISGSPVYIGGQFAGTVSYGLTFGPSSIAGLTPGEDVAALVDLPATAAIRRLDRVPRAVRLPASLARVVADRAGISAAAAAGFRQLDLPLSVSGLRPNRLARLGAELEKDGKLFVPYTGGSAAHSQMADPLGVEAGDNFAATVSYGDMTISAIGTTSYVCNGMAIAFGHPATFGGAVKLGANEADAITIAPETVGAPYKVANVGNVLGSLDQDRLAGVRGILGFAPSVTPIRTTTRVPELGRTRDGATDFVPQDWAGTALVYHLMGNYDSTFDSQGRGSASAWWVFEGTRADGSPWRLSRGNRFASSELSFETAYSIALQLELLQANPFEDVEVTNVDVETTLESQMRLYRFGPVSISKNGGPFRKTSSIRVKPGMRLVVRLVLKPQGGGAAKTVDLPFRLPRNAIPTGFIFLNGGGGGFDEFFFYEDSGEGADSFDELLDSLRSLPRNDVLTGSLQMMRPFDGEIVERALRKLRLDSVVSGSKTIRLRPARGF
jgi:hypothetical protein